MELLLHVAGGRRGTYDVEFIKKVKLNFSNGVSKFLGFPSPIACSFIYVTGRC